MFEKEEDTLDLHFESISNSSKPIISKILHLTCLVTITNCYKILMYLTMYNFLAKYLFLHSKQKNVTRHTLSMTSYTTGMMTTVDKLRQKKLKPLKVKRWPLEKKEKKMQSGNRKKDNFRSEYSISTIFFACLSWVSPIHYE